MVAIENIKAGDKVVATNPDTGITEKKTVLETYIRKVTELVHLSINGKEILTTHDHPFYVYKKGYINAGQGQILNIFQVQIIEVLVHILGGNWTRFQMEKHSK